MNGFMMVVCEGANKNYHNDNFNEIIPRALKLLAIISILLLTFSLISILDAPSDGTYEFSIYLAMPWYFWVSILTSAICGYYIILSTLEYRSNDLLFLGGIIIVIVNLILLTMPLWRGYAIYGRGDVLSHIAFMNDIVQHSTIGPSNTYPLAHILGVSFSEITSLNLYRSVALIPIFFSFFFTTSIVLLSKLLMKERRQILLATIIGSILIFGNAQMSFTPFNLSLFLIPFALYLFFKSRKSEKMVNFNFLFLIFIIFITFFHPLIALFFIFIILIIKVGVKLSDKLGISNKVESAHFEKSTKIANPILIATIVFCTWQAYVFVLEMSAQKIINSLSGSADTTQLATYSSILITNQVSFVSIITSVLLTYGQLILLLSIAFIGILRHIVLILRGHKISPVVAILSLEFLFFISISIIAFVVAYIVGYGRSLVVSLIFSIMLIPLLFFRDNSYRNRRTSLNKFHNTFLFVFICLTLISSIINLYPSPFVRLDNYQVTETELTGMGSFFNYRNDTISILEMGISQYRFYDVLYGRDVDRVKIGYDNTAPPDHFGYGESQTGNDISLSQKYLLINEIGVNEYPIMYPDYNERWRFTPDDFNRINIDGEISRIYSNGNLIVYLTTNQGEH